jgi:hypothetical protein
VCVRIYIFVYACVCVYIYVYENEAIACIIEQYVYVLVNMQTAQITT